MIKKAVPTIDTVTIRNDFPILKEMNRGRPMVYLDSAASAQKPKPVVDAISHFYLHDYANIHRGVYELSERSTKLYEQARSIVKTFINAADPHEIVFVRGTTEGINLVANSFSQQWQAGDEVIISHMEHHANIVPWYLLKEKIGIQLKVIPVLEDGSLDMETFPKLFSDKTKLVAVTHASNVLGVINPIADITEFAHAHQVPVLVDGAQAIPHMPVDVQALDCDFYVFSAHKLYGPTGVGVLYAKQKWLVSMPPYQGGGDMIETVTFDKVTFAKPPAKFEAGTPDIAGVIGLGAAIEYLQKIGMQNIYEHGQELLAYAEPALLAIPGLRIIGNAHPKVSVISFVLDNVHPHDIGTILDHEGIAIRAGHHCAMPLMERFKLPATARASFGIYNNETEVDALVAAIHLAKRLFS